MVWYSKALSLVTGLFSGGGGIVSAVDDGLKLATAVTAEVHDHNQNVAGQDHVTATDNAEKAKVNEQVAQAAVDATDGRALSELQHGGA